MNARIELVHRDHTIKAEPQATDPDGGGFWKMSIEEPGGRCVYWDVEIITSIEGIGKFLSDLCARVDALEERTSENKERD